MVEKGDYSIGEVYQGGYSSIDPNKNEYFTGYNATAGSLGMTTNPQATFKLSSDFSTKLSSGVKHMELALVSPEFFDNTPKQELKEATRLAKLTGSEISVHAPVMDSAGYGRDGRWSESQRQIAENKISDYIQRSTDINPAGNTTVVFHSAEGIGASTWEKLGDAPKSPEDYSKDNFRKAKRLIIADRETGGMIPVEKDVKFYPMYNPETGEAIYEDNKTPEEVMRIQNNTSWRDNVEQLIFSKERADDILKQNESQIRHLFQDLRNLRDQGKSDLEIAQMLTPTQKEAYIRYQTADTYLDDIRTKLNSQFSKAYELGNENQKEKLKALSQRYHEEVESYEGDLMGASKAMSSFMLELKNPEFAPRQYVSIEEFATEKSSQTFGNAAFNAYKKLGDKAPIIAIENPPATDIGLSTGEDLKNLIIKSREHFANRLIEEKGIDKKKAAKIAEMHLGATWDVGHINMIRSQGFSEEDVIKETERIAPYVKHVHLSDNFGLSHTELPMGMGNVPMKEIMKRLGEKGFEAKKVIEAGQWWQTMQRPPLMESLEGLGSPVYGEGAGPYWNQALGFQQGYLGGYGQMLPNVNFQLYGSGFTSSSLPKELGGRVGGGAGGRMGGGRE